MTITVANNAVTGTTVNKLARFTGAPSTAVIMPAGNLDGVVGVVTSGAGTTGNAIITVAGIAPCVFENSTTAGNYVMPPTSVAGDCRDSGVATPLPVPTGGIQTIGIVLSTGAAGTANVWFFGGNVTTKFRRGLYLSNGNSGLTPCNNDLIQALAANTSIFTWGANGLLINTTGTACADAAGPLDVEGGSPGNNQTTQAPIKLIGPGNATGSNSGITGGTGGPITITEGKAADSPGGSGSTGGRVETSHSRRAKAEPQTQAAPTAPGGMSQLAEGQPAPAQEPGTSPAKSNCSLKRTS